MGATRWTTEFIAQQVVMLGLYIGFIKWLLLPTIFDMIEVWKR